MLLGLATFESYVVHMTTSSPPPAPSAAPTARDVGRLRSPSRWSHPKQKILLLVGFGVAVGAFLPWLETPLGTYRGFAGPGQYLFYAGVIGIAAGLVPIRSLAMAQGAVLSAVALCIPTWQMVKLISAVGFTGWVPGIGMVLILGCGVMAARVTAAIAGSGEK